MFPCWSGSFHVLWIIFEQIQPKTHQPVSRLDGPEDEGQSLVHATVADSLLLLGGVFGILAGDVASRSSFLRDPKDGKLCLPGKAIQQVPMETVGKITRGPLGKVVPCSSM